MASKRPSEKVEIKFRERPLSEILSKKIRHPKQDKKYKSTLPGAFGWQYKEAPGR